MHGPKRYRKVSKTFLLGFKGSHDFPKFLLFFGRSRPGAQKLNVVQISGLLGEREYTYIFIYTHICRERCVCMRFRH